MRQRTVDVNQTTVFVGTQPRPVNRGDGGTQKNNSGRGPGPGGGSGAGDAAAAVEMTEGRAWTLLGAALLMLTVGAFLVRGHHYGHLHRRIEEAYFGYLQSWDRDHLAAFSASSWDLLVEGHPAPLPLSPRTSPSKRVRTKPSSRASSSSSSSPTQPAIAQSPLLEFRLQQGLIGALYPAARIPLADQHRAAHAGLWRPAVTPELRMGRAVTLRVRDGLTGVESRLELGRVAFTRERTIPAGGEARCMYDQQGTWQEEDATCSVHEFLWALCVKVARDKATGTFSLDTSLGGGPGCSPDWGWEAGQWRRLDERRYKINGRLYLPLSARNATVVSVRHGKDPSILEKEAVRQVAPNMEHQILFHAVGLALCFLGLVLLLSVAAFAAPLLLRRVRGAWSRIRSGRRRRRGLSGSDKGSDDDEGL
ncbi:hypothetical protein Agub_g7025 [Astrephomene gubernaculifera]|uniref:Uncharacterized protein n=1 Tax=Astrephomene gubernaculifera TaxID=47775 RepID=A0AAD3HM02_9CHLO|nr:hypothetical protein Agub_g7025 [Astrephomene gubernaculifera]